MLLLLTVYQPSTDTLQGNCHKCPSSFGMKPIWACFWHDLKCFCKILRPTVRTILTYRLQDGSIYWVTVVIDYGIFWERTKIARNQCQKRIQHARKHRNGLFSCCAMRQNFSSVPGAPAPGPWYFERHIFSHEKHENSPILCFRACWIRFWHWFLAILIRSENIP